MSRINLLLFFLVCALICPAATYYVATNGDDTRTGDGDWTNAVATISNGVAKATAAGDIVMVSNGTYVLTTNICISNGITLCSTNGRDLTIIDGGYPTITNRCVWISNASAIVEGFTLTRGGMTTNTHANRGYGGGAYVKNGTLRNCLVSNNIGVQGGGIYNDGGVVSNCVICYNTGWGLAPEPEWGNVGGGLNNYGSAAKAYDCFIFRNVATSTVGISAGSGGGVYIGGGGLLANSTVSNNGSISRGAGVFIDNGGTASNCLITRNNASYRGGGITLNNASPNIINCTNDNNTSSSDGGGIFCNNCKATIRDSYIIQNRANDNHGGGISVYANSSLLLTNCVISNNIASGSGYYGGGIYANNNGLTALWCRVVGNSASYGAGIYARSNCVLDHSVIERNYATNSNTNSGGGIYLRCGDNGNIRDCLIVGNTATGTDATAGGLGGGIYIESGATNTFVSCTIVSNFAKNNGGGVYLTTNGGDTFTDCIIASNRLNADAADRDLYLPESARSNAFYWSCGSVLTNTLQGNITNDPIFAGASAGNWRLGANSPCLNAGTNQNWMTNAYDLDGQTRIRYGTVDMGAYERINEGTIYGFR